jgi:hypothetical protein
VRVRKQTAITRPVARTEGLLVETVGDETVAYDLNTKEAHCLKSLAAAVFMYADGSKTSSDIAELAAYRMGTPVTEADVNDALAQLESRALLDAGPVVVVRNGISRRDAIKRFSAVAGVATVTPLIATVSASAAGSQNSLVPTGGCCGHTPDTCTGGNPLCVSGHCCQNTDATAKQCNPCKCVGDKNDCSTDQCDNPLGATVCDPLPGHTPCGKTSAGKCCYKPGDATSTEPCCTVFLSQSSGDNIDC